jgi:creatinine deaminase
MNEKELRRLLSVALDEARVSLRDGAIPIGSVLARGSEIISKGHNRRIQDGDPLAHAEIVCLRNAGRIKSFRGLTLVSTLMPCYLCAGAVVQFGLSRVVAGESRNFPGARQFMEDHGVEVVDLDDQECIRVLQVFITSNPDIWNEDIGR